MQMSQVNTMACSTSNKSTQQRNKGYYPNLHGWDFSIPPSPIKGMRSDESIMAHVSLFPLACRGGALGSEAPRTRGPEKRKKEKKRKRRKEKEKEKERKPMIMKNI